MLLKRGNLTTTYKRVEDKPLKSQADKVSIDEDLKTLEGQLIWGHEARTFKPCGSDNTFWVSDETEKLKEIYSEITKDEKPYTAIFVEIEFKDKGKAKEGFPAKYDGVYDVVNVIKARKMQDDDCK